MDDLSALGQRSLLGQEIPTLTVCQGCYKPKGEVETLCCSVIIMPEWNISLQWGILPIFQQCISCQN